MKIFTFSLPLLRLIPFPVPPFVCRITPLSSTGMFAQDETRERYSQMRVLTFVLALALVALAGGAAIAQEGHPLKGSWIGTWSGNKVHGDDVLFVLNWDGKAVTGMINPGTDNI